MKKAIFKGFAVAALALAVLFTGCKNEPSNIETISTDAVEITAKAYPGYNYITWTIPENFQDRDVSILRDDGKAISAASTGGHYAIDVDIKDGVTYKYTAYVAAPASGTLEYQYKFNATTNASLNDVSTDVKGVIYVGNSSSATCKAINPICIKKDGTLMSALDLCEYEDGCDEDYIINADNIIFEYDAFKNQYDVAFPTKEYLTYKPYLFKGNYLDTFGLTADTNGVPNGKETYTFTAVSDSTDNKEPFISDATADTKFYTNDTAVRYNGVVTSAGEYTVVVEVTAKNKSYSTSRITAAKKVVLEALDIETDKGTRNVKAGYIDEGKTIRLLWTPAEKKDTSKWAVDSYKVYAKNTVTGVYTEIAPAKKAKVNEEGEAVEDEDGNVIMETTLAIAKGLQANEDVYYIDYAVPSNLVRYDFYVVLSDSGKYESTSNTTYVGKYADIPEVSFTPVAYNGNNEDTANVYNAFYNIDNDEQTNDAVLTVKANASGVATVDLKTVKAKYKVIAKSANNAYLGLTSAGANALWLDTEFTDATAVPATDFTRYDFIVKNVAADSEVIWLYEVSQKNKKSKYFTYSANGTSGINAITTSDTTVSVRTNGATADELKANPKVTITVLPIDNPTAPTAQQTQNNFANYTWKIYYAKKNVAASTQGKFKSYDDITSWSDGPAVTIAWNKDDAKFEFVKKDFELVVDTPNAEANADNYADTGAKKTSLYKDTYVFKIVKTNKNAAADATGNSVIFYQEYTYTKNGN